MRERLWEHQAHDEVAVETLTRDLGVPPVVARLLCLRGLCDPDAAARFLSPRIAHLHDPWQLADMAKAVDRLLAAIDGRERVAIHGDYDVDGVTSTVMLRRSSSGWAATSCTSSPNACATGTDCSPRRSSTCRPRAPGWWCRSTAASDQSRRRAGPATSASISSSRHHEPDRDLPDALAVSATDKRQGTFPNDAVVAQIAGTCP